MKFLHTYNKFITSLNENKKQAISILKKKSVSPKNKDFKKLVKLLEDKFNNLNLIGLLTKFRFQQDTSITELEDLVKWLHDNNGAKLLKNPILQYKTYESLKDEIIQIDISRKIRMVMNELPNEQKQLVNEADIPHKKEFEGWCVKLHDIKYKKPLFKKISSCKTIEELLERVSDFVRTNSDIKNYDDKLREIKEMENVEITLEDPDKGVIITRILNYNTSNALGSSAWCISTSQGQWMHYVYKNMGYQYFIWDYSKSVVDPLHQIGVTIGPHDKVTHCHDMNDKGIMNNLPEVVTDNIGKALRGMDTEEVEKFKGNYREEKRGMAKQIYENEDGLEKLAQALITFLKNQGIWSDEMVLYDILPQDDYNGLPLFEVNIMGDKEISYAIETEDVVDEKYKEREGSLIDDIGYFGYNEWFWQDSIDMYSLEKWVSEWLEESAPHYIEMEDGETEEEHQHNMDTWKENELDEFIDDPIEWLYHKDLLYKKTQSNGFVGDYTTWEYSNDSLIDAMFDKDDFIQRSIDVSGRLSFINDTIDETEHELHYDNENYLIYILYE